MSYLKFDKTLMINLQDSLSREVLRTNQSGAYQCSTIVDCNTRKYHGLLVLPLPDVDDELHVLLSSLDATVVQHGAEFNLGLHRYRGDNFSPNGHKYIRQYDCEKVPTTIYRVGGVVLSKSTVFVHHESRILISYTLIDAHSETQLRFKPFLAFRSVRAYTHENNQVNRTYVEIANGIKTSLYNGYPELCMQFNKPAVYTSYPDWYRGIEYSKEKERGYYFDEDLFVPGTFEVAIKKGETVVFSAAISEIDPSHLEHMYQSAVADRTPRTSFYNCLKNSARQFINKQGDNYYLIAGYPWFKARARDQFIALPGCTLAIDQPENYHHIMQTAINVVRTFMKTGFPDKYLTEAEHPDVLLWMIWSLQQYAKADGMQACRERYRDVVEEVMEYLSTNSHPNLFVQPTGLITSDGSHAAISWMNAVANGLPIVRRTGHLVEFNALWYNAICFTLELQSDHESALAARLTDLKGLIQHSFVATFLNRSGYLYDYVDGDFADWSVRPNMLFAAALDHSPLSKPQRKVVLDFVTKELLTPKGIRTLSPQSGGYNPNYVGSQSQRDYAYHQGTVWPWLMGFYLEAYLKIHQMSGISFVERMLIGFDDEMSNHCISTLSELYDGNPPYKGRGAVSFAMNVAEILRVLKLLKTLNNTKQDI